MNLARVRKVIGVLLVTSFLLGCQGAESTPESKAASTAKVSPERAAPIEKAAPAEKVQAAAGQKPEAKLASTKTGAVPTSLPKATQEFLGKLNKDSSILAGLDQELNVPQEWIDGAKKEGTLSIIHTLDPPQAEVLLKPFKERYPFVEVDYNRGAHEEKLKAIVAAQSGRPNVDIIIGIGGQFFIMKEADLPANLTDLPGWKNIPDEFKDANGEWVGIHIRHWAMAYNTDKVKEADLPKTWDDLLTNPIWRNGNLALANRPQLWMLQLWRAKGEQWAKNFITRLFTEVKPQFRKEDINGMLGLLIAGEFYATVPSGEYRVNQKVMEGAPVRFWTPEPIPLASSELTILKKTTNPNAARIFANWMLSKEGQMAQYVAESAPPVHKDMRSPEWLPFADIITGKPIALRYPEDEQTIQPALLEIWEQQWLKGGGQPR